MYRIKNPTLLEHIQYQSKYDCILKVYPFMFQNFIPSSPNASCTEKFVLVQRC